MDPLRKMEVLELREAELLEIQQAGEMLPDDELCLLDDLDAVELRKMDLMISTTTDNPLLQDKLLSIRKMVKEAQELRRQKPLEWLEYLGKKQ